MLPYWLLFGLLAIVALTRFRPAVLESPMARLKTAEDGEHAMPVGALPFVFVGVLLVAMIGLRYHVGGDWFPYARLYQQAAVLTFQQQILAGDPGYQFINWFVRQVGAGLWLVNTLCATIFVWGLVQLCRLQREPWLALLVAVPYCVIVVAMGYTRQATAMGILMAGIAALLRGNGGAVRFAAYVLAAALFHKTAIVIFPLVALSLPRSRFVNLLIAVSLTPSLYFFFVADDVDKLVRNYLEAGYSSTGATIRLAQTAIPALIFLIMRNRFDFTRVEDRVWRNFSIASLLMVILLFTTPSSTAVDRFSLYLLPLQFVVLAHIPVAITGVFVGRLLVLFYLGLTQFVWLNFARHASMWIPYLTWFNAG